MMPPFRKPPSLLRNPISFIGIAITLTSTAFGLPMMLIDMFSHQAHPYLAVLIYLVLPFVAIGGAVLILLGVLWERASRRRRPEHVVPPLPRIDLNYPKHQALVAAALIGVMVAIVLLSVTGYRAYHFTESVKFCGLVCHDVMKPEYTAYQHSPHARVACTQCHVGPGASWFVRSKISGAYQVYAVATNRYPRPIATPVKSLRPAQETCEQCHWPAKFFGAQQKTLTRYLADERNSPWQIQMLIKVGGGDPKTGATGGIHWHMNINNQMEYIASDESREVIPWVRATDHEGRSTEYMSTEQPLSPQQRAQATIRRMDCVDCHNRPSHIYRPPDQAVDQAFDAGLMDRRLPYLKREAIRALVVPYATELEARDKIARHLLAFYQREYPEVYQTQRPAIQGAAQAAQSLYAQNIFPEMKADWRAHPNHIGHLNSDGCFRCHDGLHQSPEGKVITKNCQACHTILAQGAPEEMAGVKLQEQPFRHPVDVGVDVTEYKCSQCHTGTSGVD
ncbi:MAG: NapC/NirT family cytochrome c [Candidatus Omnitrophica bacterium]|nr:NapC/NirT family cytochrome c [Candidatus Omnitrophota bacterium]